MNAGMDEEINTTKSKAKLQELAPSGSWEIYLIFILGLAE